MSETSHHHETLFMIGLNHKSADVDERSQHSYDAAGRAALRKSLGDDLGAKGSIVVSTCNRTEVYGVFPGGIDDHVQAKLVSSIFPRLNGKGPTPYIRVGRVAVFHLFRVSSGLDSLIVGESEILGQVKTAFDECLKGDPPHRVLGDLFRQALTVGKRVRTETHLGEGSVSVAAAAVKLVKKIVGRLETKSALIVGAGETGVLTARHLSAGGVEHLAIVNRTASRAVEIAREFHGEGGGLDELKERMDGADIIIACVEAPEPIIVPKLFDGLGTRTRCIVDISIPRAVDKKVADESGVFLIDIDDLQRLIEENTKERMVRADRAHEIIVDETHKFLSLQSYAALAPIVNDIKQRFDAVLTETMEDPKSKADVDAMLKRVSSKLFAAAVEGLKNSSRRFHSPAELRAAYESFLAEDD